MTPGLAELRRFVATGVLPESADAVPARALLERAGEQAVVALLDEVVSRAPAGWPADVREDMRARHRARLFDGVQRQALARHVSRRLAAKGIRTLALKGVALLDCLYDAPAERPMADVDLLAVESFDEAVDLLERDGFSALDREPHATALRERVSGGILELHRDLTSCRGFFPIDREALWQRRAETDGLARPAPEDLLVQLAIHAAFQHGFAISLCQWLDFRRFFERAAPDSALVLERARASCAEACLYAALALAGHVVGCAAPPGLVSELQRRSANSVRRAVARALDRDPSLLLEPSSPLDLARWRFSLAAGRRIRFLAKTLRPEGGVPSLVRAVRLTTRLLAAHPSQR